MIFFKRFFAHGRSGHAIPVYNLAAGIERTAQYAGLSHAVCADAQRARRGGLQFGLRGRVPQGKSDFKLFHRSPYSALREIGAISSGAKRPRW